MKPKLIVLELWGIGDLMIATPFLNAAAEKYEVTLLAKPYAEDLQPRFWPNVKVVPFIAPWTAFKHKYNFLAWQWPTIFRLWKQLRSERFDFGLSARWYRSVRSAGDPRDHLLLWLIRAKVKLGFPAPAERFLLTKSLQPPDPRTHRYENWRVMAQALAFELPPLEKLRQPDRRNSGILIHTGASQPARVWPLERFRKIAQRLRAKRFQVQIACDSDQEQWWRAAGEQVIVPCTIGELIRLLENAGALIGNDSGPGHLAAFCGVPTFTVFGPSLPEWFAPLHPASEWLDGKTCSFKPCSDYCRFPIPYCIANSTEDEVFQRIEAFLGRTLSPIVAT